MIAVGEFCYDADGHDGEDADQQRKDEVGQKRTTHACGPADKEDGGGHDGAIDQRLLFGHVFFPFVSGPLVQWTGQFSK